MAEEIVRIIKIDTKNSGKSINDLRKDIKSLRQELEKTEVGSKEFEVALKKLTQTQKEYNSVQQQIRDLSRTNQQDMVKFASFARNLGKSYSALNAAIGLFADKNEDVQKAMLKVQRTIQLVQGLDGIAGLIRDLPKVINGFKSWLNALSPIERQVDRIAKGINGISPEKLRQINEANRAGQGGATTTATAGGQVQQINQQTQAYQQQQRVITALNAVRDQEIKKLTALQEQQAKTLAEATKATAKGDEVTNTMGRLAGQIEVVENELNTLMAKQPSLEAAKANPRIQELANKLAELNAQMVALKAQADEAIATAAKAAPVMDKTQAEIDQTKQKITELEGATAALGKAAKTTGNFLKTIGKTVGWTLVISAAITLVLKLLDSIGLTVDGFWDWVTGANSAAEAQRKLNKEISEGTNQAASKQIVVLKELSIAYQKLGDSAEKKKEFLQKYSDKIKETGISIDGLKKAEDVFVNNTDNYVNAIMARAKAQAVENAAVKIYQEYLDERYDLEQKFEKNKNKAAGTNSKEEYITLLKGMGMTAEQAEEAWNTATNKRQQKILDQINAADKKVQERLKKMFEDVAELEKEYAGFFGSVTATTNSGPSTDWEKEYKEALEALKNYVQDYLDVFKDARTKELDDNRKAYEENVKNINLNFLAGVKAAQGNAKKLLELEEEKNKALKMAQLAYERQRLDIIDKYNDQVYEKQKAELDREYTLLEKQIERNRKLNDTSNLQEPAQFNYQTKYKQPGVTSILGLGDQWTNVYQTKENLEDQYKAQVEYNDRVYLLTKKRVKNENKLLEEERRTLEEKAALLREQLNSTDVNDLDKRRELADQIIDIEDSLFTTKQTIVENEIALDNAQRQNEEDNLAAFLEMQEKRRTALNATLEVASNAAGALANIFRQESQNDKKSEEQRQRALKAYKAFAITQAIADTYKGANEAYAAMASIPYVGPALGIAAAAAAIIMGIANVRSIMSESISGSTSSASVTAPAPVDTAPIEYTRNLVGDKELDEINQPIKCYVLEQDITKSQNKVKVTEMNATF